MAQLSTKPAQAKHGKQQSNSLSSINATSSTRLSHKTDSQQPLQPHNNDKKKDKKVGSLKRWFSRFGTSSSSSTSTSSSPDKSEEKAHSEIERKLNSLSHQKTMS